MKIRIGHLTFHSDAFRGRVAHAARPTFSEGKVDANHQKAYGREVVAIAPQTIRSL
jgi:hypothetical protein